VDDRATAPDVPTTGALARLADEVLPALIAWLDVSELGELEVRHEGWRVRLRRSLAPTGVAPAAVAPPAPAGPQGEVDRSNATSPAVGYYLPNDRTPVGRAVAAGDVVGWVEVLGVRQEVVAPRDGVVGRRLAEPGQAVEYGQDLLVIDPVRRTPASGDDGEGDVARPAAAAGA
jgi:acetyl-CoA carboxylase biotin carboxyl carrier protein